MCWLRGGLGLRDGGGRGGNGKGFIVLAGCAALVLGIALVISSLNRDSNPETNARATVAHAATARAAVVTTVADGPSPTASAGTTQDPTATPRLDTAVFQVALPQLLAPTGPLGVVRGYYSETYTIDIFTVRWRPGAFPPERAAEVAAATSICIGVTPVPSSS